MEHLRPWFRLKSVAGIGNLLMKRLIDRFQTPERVMAATPQELIQVDGINSKLAAAIQTHRLPSWVEADLEKVEETGCRIIVLTDPDYPPLLLQIPDPPPLLYVDGTLDQTTRHIAIVGSRHATEYGLTITHRLAADLVTLGFCIVSGMARGIDTAAHQGALDGKGATVAVLGSGLSKIYPPENKALAQNIAGSGAVISEFRMDASPLGHHFPVRNRIISGMSMGVVVVEAGRKSGSLITARLALEQNRDVFAVPGSIRSYTSSGTHNLIKQGAKLVDHAQDIVDELSFMFTAAEKSVPPNSSVEKKRFDDLNPEERKVIDNLNDYPVHIDELSRRLDMDISKLTSFLLQLELKGIVKQSPGKLFSINTQ